MKQLIVNADDCGISKEVNAAIEKCYKAGSITGTSIMARGGYFEDASLMLKDIGKADVGAHLTLTGEENLFGNNFIQFGFKYYSYKIDYKLVYDELLEQIKIINDAGLKITHLDSHEHVHMFPRVLYIMIEIAVKYGIKYIRIPYESSIIIKNSYRVKDLIRHFSLKAYSFGKSDLVKDAGLIPNDLFWGHFHSCRIDESVFGFVCRNLVDGVSEIAFHPGENDESKLLTSEGFNKIISDNDIKLVSHGDLFGAGEGI